MTLNGLDLYFKVDISVSCIRYAILIMLCYYGLYYYLEKKGILNKLGLVIMCAVHFIDIAILIHIYSVQETIKSTTLLNIFVLLLLFNCVGVGVFIQEWMDKHPIYSKSGVVKRNLPYFSVCALNVLLVVAVVSLLTDSISYYIVYVLLDCMSLFRSSI